MKLATNLEMNFPGDMPLLDRVAATADLGYSGADIFRTQGKDLDALAAACQKHKITIGMVVGSSLTEGLNDPANHEIIEKSVAEAARDAEQLGALFVTVLSGNTRQSAPASTQNQAILDGLRRLIPLAEKRGVTLILEMLNSRYDHPGYYLDDTELMTSLVRAVNHPQVKGLYDIYHAGVMRGNLVEDICASIDSIAHFHAAGIPGRTEPKDGEQNYPAICAAIDKSGFDGYISMEYKVTKGWEASLKETRDWIQGA